MTAFSKCDYVNACVFIVYFSGLNQSKNTLNILLSLLDQMGMIFLKNYTINIYLIYSFSIFLISYQYRILFSHPTIFFKQSGIPLVSTYWILSWCVNEKWREQIGGNVKFHLGKSSSSTLVGERKFLMFLLRNTPSSA